MNRGRFTIKFASGPVIASLADEASFESALAEIMANGVTRQSPT